MMQDLLYLVRLRWLAMVLPLLVIPSTAAFFLVSGEPMFISRAKVWTKERNEGSSLLKIQREGLQEETHAKIQTEILFSDRVIELVVDRLGLVNPPKSQSLLAHWGFSREVSPNPDPKKAFRQAVKALKKSLHVELLNPEILLLEIRMNEPYLSQRVLGEVMVAYREIYRDILQEEINEYAVFLGEEVERFRAFVSEKSSALAEFERANPNLQHQATASLESRIPAAMGKEVGDVSPVPLIMARISELELERNRLRTVASPGNRELRQVGEEIESNRSLLQKYSERLNDQAELLIRHQQVQWDLANARERLAEVQGEFDRVVISKGTKLDNSIGITVLDEPSLDLDKIAPKKKAILGSSLFMSVLLGIASVYLLSLFDPTYRRAKEIEDETGLPVLGVIREKV